MEYRKDDRAMRKNLIHPSNTILTNYMALRQSKNLQEQLLGIVLTPELSQSGTDTILA